MISGKRRLLLSVIFMLCLSIMFSLPGYALLIGNDSDRAFVTNTDDGSLKTVEYSVGAPSGSLRDYLIQGAVRFLDSYSYALAFLRQVEMSELQAVNIDEIKIQVNNALTKMEEANAAYINMKGIADVTEYNPCVIWALQHFNYNNFMRYNNLNRPIFKEMQGYLQFGDVRGAYARMVSDTAAIADILYKIKADVDAGQMPEGSYLWEVNQAYSETLLFGQYMAAVFIAILNN